MGNESKCWGIFTTVPQEMKQATINKMLFNLTVWELQGMLDELSSFVLPITWRILLFPFKIDIISTGGFLGWIKAKNARELQEPSPAGC